MTTEDKEKMIKETMQEITNAGYKQMLLRDVDVAAIIGVHKSTLYNWRRDGIGIEFKKNKGKRGGVKYSKRAVAEWIVTGNIKVA